MATFYNQCHYNVLATQAGIRLNFYNCILTSLGSLCAIERYLGLLQTPGWVPMNRDRVQKIMETAEQSKNRSEADLRKINEILKNGCPSCILKHCNAQEHLPVIPDEMIENIENLVSLDE